MCRAAQRGEYEAGHGAAPQVDPAGRTGSLHQDESSDQKNHKQDNRIHVQLLHCRKGNSVGSILNYGPLVVIPGNEFSPWQYRYKHYSTENTDADGQ